MEGVSRIGGIDELARGVSAGKGGNIVESFHQMLSDALDTVNNLQANADKMTQQLATGEIEDLHQVMIAVEEVNIALQLTVQIRNKIVEAYQEVMRMQV